MSAVIEMGGLTFGRLTVLAREGSDKRGRATWVCKCECGRELVARGDTLRNGLSTSCGRGQCSGMTRLAGPGHPLRHEVPTYAAVHQQMRRDYGPASNYMCVDCRVSGAREWSYAGTDPNELVSEDGLPYSREPGFYQPRCKSCHTTYDRVKGANTRGR